MNTEETSTPETNDPEATFAPPITVSVSTNNLSRCELRIAGADGVAESIVVPSDGNVYQGLHKARGPLEQIINRLLAKHGILPPPAAEEPEGDAGDVPADAETNPAVPSAKKKSSAKAKASTEAK